MKRIYGMAAAVAFVLAATAAFAQGADVPKAAPATKPAEATAQNANAAPARGGSALGGKDAKSDASELCKKKGLVGLALDECVKNELAKSDTKPHGK